MTLVVRARRARTVVAAVAVLLPGRLRRVVHTRLLGYELDPTAHIGHSFVDVDRLTMGPRATIGHLDAVRGCERVELGEEAMVGHLVFVNSVRRGKGFLDNAERQPELILHRHSWITTMHFIDCCDRVELEERAGVAGYWSLLMTHSFDHRASRQSTSPIVVGERTTVSTRCTLLPGSQIGKKCIVAAGATVIGKLDEDSKLYAGTPAKVMRDLDPDSYFFRRESNVLR